MGIWGYFCLWCHSGLYTMQKLSYLCNITLVSTRFQMVMTQIQTQVYKDSLTFTYPPNMYDWSVLQISYPWIGSLLPLLCWLLIPCNSYTYIPVQHWFVFARFTSQWSWGSGKPLSYGGRHWSCWKLCDLWGLDSRTNTLIIGKHFSQTWKLKAFLTYVSFCIRFVVICGCSCECHWYIMGQMWGGSHILVWSQGASTIKYTTPLPYIV
jgi:hypothetical protein